MVNISKIVVDTESGKLEGTLKDGLFTFQGIPYAAPPIGELRWMPPQPVKHWAGIRPAQAFGPIAPQSKGGLNIMYEAQAEETQSEDCLYLNVWSPGLDNSRRPVMVWVHGGAFNRGSGSNPSYSGSKLAQRGNVVVVTINYRLGSLGFLHLDKITGGRIPATGNEGLSDQIAALRWVRDNISSFGGDPNNITVFGESAGAMSIGCLLAMPLARGLFQKAILQSGSNTFKTLDEATQLAEQFLGLLGVKAGEADNLRSIPVDQLLSAQNWLAASMGIKGSVLEPVVESKILPVMPIEGVKQGSAAQVTLLVGTNRDEAKFMSAMDPGMTRIDDAGLIKRWQQFLPPDLVPALIQNCRESLTGPGMPISPAELAIALQTDRQFRIPAIRMVEAQLQHNPATYSYLFEWQSAAPGLGACHALDVGFVFGYLSPRFHGSGPEAEKLSGRIQDAWLAFAKTGNPSCESLGDWPQSGTRRLTMILGESCRVEAGPFQHEYRAWDPIPDIYLG
jgi:para-nitrobenzyl esterase